MQWVPITPCPGLLRRDRNSFLNRRRIVRPNLRSNPILKRRDDFSAGCVVLGVGAEDHRNIERQADGVAFNLHVAFLHDVEQADLDLSRQIGEFIDREDSAVGAGQ